MKYLNRLIKVKTHTPIENQRHFKGQLSNVSQEAIEINMNGKIVYIPFQNIGKANLELES